MGISVLLILTTLAAPLNEPLFKHFDVGKENNLAALWSSMLLMMIAVHAYDGWAAHRASAAAVARAWLIVAVVMAALSLDEFGTLHERVPAIGDHSRWLTVALIGTVIGGVFAYSVFVLFRSPPFVASAWIICAGLLVFAAALMLERWEKVSDWAGYAKALRTAAEEGAELLGILLILKATMGNTRLIPGRTFRISFPVFEAVGQLRGLIVIGTLGGGALLAFVSLYLEPEAAHRQVGHPTTWLGAVLFLLTGLVAIRSVLRQGRQAGWQDWGLMGIAGIGGASMTLHPQGAVILPVLLGLAITASVVWYLNPRQSVRSTLPAVVFLALIFALAWPFQGNEFFAYCLVQFVPLAIYHGTSAVVVSEARRQTRAMEAERP